MSLLPPPNQNRPTGPGPAPAPAAPKVLGALLAGAVALIVLIYTLASPERPTMSANALSTIAVPGMAGDTEAPTPLPTATAIPTTAPVTVPDLAPAVPLDPAPTARDSAPHTATLDQAGLAPAATAEPAPATIVTVATEEPTATPEPDPTSAVEAATDPSEDSAGQPASAEAEPEPEPTATPLPTPEPTATPLPTPEPTATPHPTPEPTATPLPTPEPTATPEPAQVVVPGGHSAEELFVFNAINDVRARSGLPALELRADISEIARDWSAQMANAGGISHRPGSQLNVMLPSGWRAWGENVAEAPTVEWAQNALERSPGHLANMVNDFNVVGVGVVVAPSGQVFVTHNFARY